MWRSRGWRHFLRQALRKETELSFHLGRASCVANSELTNAKSILALRRAGDGLVFL